MKHFQFVFLILGAASALAIGSAHADALYRSDPSLPRGIGNDAILVSGAGDSSSDPNAAGPAGGEVAHTGDLSVSCLSANSVVRTPLGLLVAYAAETALALDALQCGNDRARLFDSAALAVHSLQGDGTSHLTASDPDPSVPLPRSVTPSRDRSPVNAVSPDVPHVAASQGASGPNDRYGLSASVSDATGETDRFFRAKQKDSGAPFLEIRELGALALLLLALIGIAFARRRRG